MLKEMWYGKSLHTFQLSPVLKILGKPNKIEKIYILLI